MRRGVAVGGLALCVLAAGCNISQGPAATSSPSPLPAVSLLTSAVPSPQLDAAWSLHPDVVEGYAVGFPDTWAFVFKNSPTYDADLKAVNNAEVTKFFTDGFSKSPGNGPKLIAAEPRSAQSGFVTNLSVFKTDLGVSATAPTLAGVTSSKINLFSKNQAISGDIKRQQIEVPAGAFEQLQYSIKPNDKPVAVSTYLGTTDSGGRRYLLEIVVGTNVQDPAGLFDRIIKSFRLLPPVPSASPSAG